MAYTFIKDVLKPGEYVLRDGRRVSFSLADLRQIVANDRLARQRGLATPLTDEHQSIAPATPAQLSRTPGVLGLVGMCWLEGDTLWAEVEAKDRRAAERVKQVRWVSPEVRGGLAAGGGLSGARMSHLALTPVPVRKDQRPPRAVRLSHGEVIYRLSLADRRAGAGEITIELPRRRPAPTPPVRQYGRDESPLPEMLAMLHDGEAAGGALDVMRQWL